MTPVTPRMRATIEGGPEGLQVVIPAKRNPFVVIFLGIWLAGWLMGLLNAITRLGRDFAQDPLLLVWLTIWAVGGSVIASVSCYAVFELWLRTQLPKGILGF